MVKDPRKFTFNARDPAIRVPSARQLVYADKRANPKGRLPDDTWIIQGNWPENEWVLRPQDLPEGFRADGDTWYFARVCGTFNERTGWHGCQMPEQLLGRIIRASSNEGDLVLDPFAGSGTTLAVAKKLGRRFLGFEISADYTKRARTRLDKIKPGDPLDGAADPLTSVPSTAHGRKLGDAGPAPKRKRRPLAKEQRNLPGFA
jgi:site-specific DNA-methyltransferase (adenine-specific)